MNSMGYAKKEEREEKKNIHAKRHERKKCMPKSIKKRKTKRKKEIKIAHTFK